MYEEVSSPIEVMLINMKYKNEWVIKISYLIVCQMHQKERPQYVSLRIWYYGTLYVQHVRNKDIFIIFDIKMKEIKSEMT